MHNSTPLRLKFVLNNHLREIRSINSFNLPDYLTDNSLIENSKNNAKQMIYLQNIWGKSTFWENSALEIIQSDYKYKESLFDKIKDLTCTDRNNIRYLIIEMLYCCPSNYLLEVIMSFILFMYYEIDLIIQNFKETKELETNDSFFYSISTCLEQIVSVIRIGSLKSKPIIIPHTIISILLCCKVDFFRIFDVIEGILDNTASVLRQTYNFCRENITEDSSIEYKRK